MRKELTKTDRSEEIIFRVQSVAKINMPDLSAYPARVSRSTAMQLLCIKTDVLFRKVVDATPEIVHRLPGEKRSRYRISVIADLLARNPGVRPEGRR